MSLDVFFLANAIGSAAFALSGFFVGARKHLDYMGLFIVSLLTASGGGMLRDVLIGRVPLLLSDSFAFALVCAVLMLAIVFKLYRFENIDRRRWFVISDSIGLVAFSVTGTLVGIEYNLPVFGGMVLAFLTATGGGIIRDILVNETPALLKSDFYGSISILIAASLYALHALSIWNDNIIACVFAAALALRLIAHRYRWHLPKLKP